MRGLRRHRNRKQVKIVLCMAICLLTIMTVGYAAFSTNIGLNAKGNLIECYQNRKWDFDHKKEAQEITISCPGVYLFELWGAGNNYSGGGYTSGKISLQRNDKFYLYVGEQGHDNNSDTIGGWNGGGNTIATTQGKSGMTGSGSTDVRTVSGDWDNFNSLKSRIMVAGGAGGVGGANQGANGGGLVGYDGSSTNTDYLIYLGKGGTQTAGGAAPTKYDAAQSNGTPGLFGKGGTGGASRDDTSTGGGGAGGGGYFGGSGASGLSNGTFAAGGGSSFISGHVGCIAIDQNSTESNIQQRKGTNNATCVDNSTDVLCSRHYSNYIFTETEIIDGKGYGWTNNIGSYEGQPQPDSTIAAGHIGNGHARITLISLN